MWISLSAHPWPAHGGRYDDVLPSPVARAYRRGVLAHAPCPYGQQRLHLPPAVRGVRGVRVEARRAASSDAVRRARAGTDLIAIVMLFSTAN